MRQYKNTWIGNGLQTEGDVKNLGKDVLALVKENSQGAKIVSPELAGNMVGEDDNLVLYRGTGQAAKYAKTMPIKSIKFKGITFPQSPRPASVILGFDGVNTNKTIPFATGKSQSIVIDIMGESLSMLGFAGNHYQISHTFSPMHNIDVECEDACATIDCKPIVARGIYELLDRPIVNGYRFSDIASVAPITSCDDDAVTTADVKFYTLTKCDSGSASDLSAVQNTVPFAEVVRESRDGSTSVYKILNETGATLDDFEVVPGSLLKGCEDCPTGYTATAEGYIYKVEIADAGADISATAETLTNAVSGSGIKIENKGDTGVYIVSLSEILSDDDLNTFITANPTATVSGGDTYEDAMCVFSGTPEAIAWVEGETCTTTTAKYTIILEDDNCDGSRLTELQNAYPELTVTELDGASAFPPSNCRRAYEATVTTNIVCSSCNPESYISTAPASYMGETWFPSVSSEESANGDCLCGIQITPKLVEFFPPSCLSDKIATIKGDITIVASKQSNLEAGSLSSSESKVDIPVSQTEGRVGTQYGADFEMEITRQNKKEQYGIASTDKAAQYVLGQEFPLESGKQYPVATYHIEVDNNAYGNSEIDTQYLNLAVVLTDTSADTIKSLKQINYTK